MAACSRPAGFEIERIASNAVVPLCIESRAVGFTFVSTRRSCSFSWELGEIVRAGTSSLTWLLHVIEEHNRAATSLTRSEEAPRPTLV